MTRVTRLSLTVEAAAEEQEVENHRRHLSLEVRKQQLRSGDRESFSRTACRLMAKQKRTAPISKLGCCALRSIREVST